MIRDEYDGDVPNIAHVSLLLEMLSEKKDVLLAVVLRVRRVTWERGRNVRKTVDH